MCRAGTNKNGDHFTSDELAARYTTAINKKIDLKHSQDLTDIVGGIINAEFVDDEAGGRVECVGELFTADTPTAALAHKLMKRGIITQVSMECDYETGECSVCGKRVTSKNDYCVHLRKSKGGEFGGKPVFEILHGVTFTGLGLLDRKGADDNARITQVASQEARHCNCENTGGNALDEIQKENEEQLEAAKKNQAPAGGAAPPVDDKTRVKELEAENKDLKNQVLELQKRLEELEAESKAAANKARAQKLVKKLEKAGMAFASDDDREQELSRLAGLSDEAFAATEAAYEKVTQARAQCPNAGKPEAEKESAEPEKSASASADRQMRSDAGVRPLDVDDSKSSLEDKLRDGFMTAYRERVGLVGAGKD